jgi:hypothetical protein
MLITDEKESVTAILQLIEATIVLHNMLIEVGKVEKKEWIDEDDFSDIDDAERAPILSPMGVLNIGVGLGAAKDERRRRLMYYF